MGRLFWKIFLWFWITLLLIGGAVAWGTAIYIHNSDTFQQRDFRTRIIQQQVRSISQVLYYSGDEATRDLLTDERQTRFHYKIYVFNDLDDEILGRTLESNTPGLKQHASVESLDGEVYQIFSTQQARQNRSAASLFFRPFKRSPSIYLVWLGIALFVSGLVCFWLAWYLSKPIRTLQKATQQLSQGKLDTRVAKLIGNRRDEIADLGKDFDFMAGRLQNLINNQKQLLSDVSHELRSPLARLNVALGLARKKMGPEAQNEILRIEHESNRLDDLVGQVLTLSRLEAGAVYRKEDYIDIAALLEEIIKDCDYEATDQGKNVVFHYSRSWTINSNGELLRRALENIIRNAIHYTENNSTVEVTLEAYPDVSNVTKGKKPEPYDISISICDQGSGVTPENLARLFEPFVRLSEARDRDSGGYGLGLAIANRAIEFHQGEIIASNNDPKGLCIEVLLPIIE